MNVEQETGGNRLCVRNTSQRRGKYLVKKGRGTVEGREDGNIFLCAFLGKKKKKERELLMVMQKALNKKMKEKENKPQNIKRNA